MSEVILVQAHQGVAYVDVDACAAAWQKALSERHVPMLLATTGVDLRRHGAGLPHQFERLSAHSSQK